MGKIETAGIFIINLLCYIGITAWKFFRFLDCVQYLSFPSSLCVDKQDGARGSGVIMSGDIADLPVMKKMDDNRGLMIFRDASHKYIQPLTLAYFRRDLIKIW